MVEKMDPLILIRGHPDESDRKKDEDLIQWLYSVRRVPEELQWLCTRYLEYLWTHGGYQPPMNELCLTTGLSKARYEQVRKLLDAKGIILYAVDQNIVVFDWELMRQIPHMPIEVQTDQDWKPPYEDVTAYLDGQEMHWGFKIDTSNIPDVEEIVQPRNTEWVSNTSKDGMLCRELAMNRLKRRFGMTSATLHYYGVKPIVSRIADSFVAQVMNEYERTKAYLSGSHRLKIFFNLPCYTEPCKASDYSYKFTVADCVIIGPKGKDESILTIIGLSYDSDTRVRAYSKDELFLQAAAVYDLYSAIYKFKIVRVVNVNCNRANGSTAKAEHSFTAEEFETRVYGKDEIPKRDTKNTVYAKRRKLEKVPKPNRRGKYKKKSEKAEEKKDDRSERSELEFGGSFG